MPDQTRIVAPGPDTQSVRTADGQILRPPPGWVLLPPGDATLTRRVKAAGSSWTVQQKRGRKTFSLGVWAPGETIEAVRQALADQRSSSDYAKRREADVRRRDQKQQQYAQSFRDAVLAFLAFAPCYAELAGQLADAITGHATPVGSGTVARTQRIPLQRRAEAAVIAWLRHQTTAYEQMAIPRVKGKRREVRRLLAEQSRQLLAAYRSGLPVASQTCPLQQAIGKLSKVK